NLIWAALELYQATLQGLYLTAARGWAGVLDRHYWVAGPCGYAMSADDTGDVLVRLRSAADDATPNANAVMASKLATLAIIAGETSFARRASDIADAFSGDVARNPLGHAGLLAAAFDLIAPQLVIISKAAKADGCALEAVLNSVSMPGAAQFTVTGPRYDDVTNSLFEGKTNVAGKPAAYVCVGPQCTAPVTEPEELRRTLMITRSAL
ncbi:MAG: thioredoxin domain-containing protein, partial [Methyloceanibacter sp.]